MTVDNDLIRVGTADIIFWGNNPAFSHRDLGKLETEVREVTGTRFE
jgi:hypothetical protein